MKNNVVQIQQFTGVISFLRSSDLPTEDFNKADITIFGKFIKDELIGCIGFEQFDETGLLRSLSVAKQYRGRGIGEQLVKYLEEYAAGRGIIQLYLLTETAEIFFTKLNYQVKDRKEAPDVLKASTEFTQVCPESAVLMMKKL